MTPTEIGITAALNFERRTHASTAIREFRNLHNYASVALDMAQMKERCAEVHQSALVYVGKEGMGKRFGEFTEREAEIARAFASYVAFGKTDL